MMTIRIGMDMIAPVTFLEFWQYRTAHINHPDILLRIIQAQKPVGINLHDMVIIGIGTAITKLVGVGGSFFNRLRVGFQ